MPVVLILLSLAARAAPPEGAAVYAAKCQACHGAEGRGDGPAARALPKPPRDFTNPEFWQTMTEARLRSAITQGLPGTIMRGFPMAEPQLAQLVAYVQSLKPPPAR
jgi:high-affinity iron transporter